MQQLLLVLKGRHMALKINFIQMHLVALICVCGSPTTTADVTTEKNLMEYLLSDQRYNKLLRPISGQVNVNFHMVISQLIGVDEQEQYMTTKVWLPQTWQDRRLMWNPTEFSNIVKLQLPSFKIWLPDIVLYNNNDGQYEVSLSSNAVITYRGDVSWTPQAIYKSTCSIQVKSFPFDWQNCSMIFRSWTYTSKDLNLTLKADEADTFEMVPSGEWQVANAPVYRRDCCKDSDFQQLSYSLIMKRKPLFYVMNLIIPCVLITFLAIMVFYTPSDCGEKMTLCISVLLALTVFLLLLSKMTPPTSLEIPMIGKYLLFTMCLVTLSVITSVVVLNLHHRTSRTHRMPKWIQRCFLEILPPYILIRPKPVIIEQDCKTPDISVVGISGRRGPCMIDPEFETVMNSPEIREVASMSEYISKSAKKNDEERQISEDWKFVAMIVDRILFYLFLVTFFVGSVVIFL